MPSLLRVGSQYDAMPSFTTVSLTQSIMATVQHRDKAHGNSSERLNAHQSRVTDGRHVGITLKPTDAEGHGSAHL